jgi:hypothetical protein
MMLISTNWVTTPGLSNALTGPNHDDMYVLLDVGRSLISDVFDYFMVSYVAK